jgi:hypothetical protein
VLVGLLLTGCVADTPTPDGAPPSSARPDDNADASTPGRSSPHASVDIVIPVGGEGFAPDKVDAGTWEPATCGDEAERLSVVGSSPLGPLRVTSVGVRYWSGFTSGTGLRLEGLLGEQTMVLTAEGATVPTDEGLRPELPPGHYRPGNNWDDLYVTLLTRESSVSLHDAELTIEQHDSVSPLQRGSLIALRGTLRVFEPGWSLDLPFAITSVCETNFEGGLR